MKGLNQEQIDEISSISSEIASIDKVILFGSRAMGTNSASSDVDLALVGAKITLKEQLHINAQLNESRSLLKYDVVRFSTIRNEKLIEHIKKYGVVVYAKEDKPGSSSTF